LPTTEGGSHDPSSDSHVPGKLGYRSGEVAKRNPETNQRYETNDKLMYSPADTIPDPGPSRLLLCYITDRSQFGGTATENEGRLLAKITESAVAGIDFIQLREKDLNTREMERLARRAVAAIPAGSQTKLLINSRTDVMLAAGAHGVHLPAGDLPASEVRAVLVKTGISFPVIGVSVHSPAETAAAEAHGADFTLFAPVFEKNGMANPLGLQDLHKACRRPRIDGTPIPVLALGGITLENARQCFEAGAAGIAAIRLFQQNPVKTVIGRLRSLLT
jgi:thiamine-phosphate pyrophosphorylase